MSANLEDAASFGGLEAKWAAKLGFHIALKAAHDTRPPETS